MLRHESTTAVAPDDQTQTHTAKPQISLQRGDALTSRTSGSSSSSRDFQHLGNLMNDRLTDRLPDRLILPPRDEREEPLAHTCDHHHHCDWRHSDCRLGDGNRSAEQGDPSEVQGNLVCWESGRGSSHLVLKPLLSAASPRQYGIVMDAGSSHTSVYIYRWPAEKENDTGRVEEMHSCQVAGRHTHTHTLSHPHTHSPACVCAPGPARLQAQASPATRLPRGGPGSP